MSATTGTSLATDDNSLSAFAKRIVNETYIPSLLSTKEKYENFNSCDGKLSDADLQLTVRVNDILKATKTIMLEQKSPDIFPIDDDDDDDDDVVNEQSSAKDSLSIENERSCTDEYSTQTNHTNKVLHPKKHLCKTNGINLPLANYQFEDELLKRIRKCLSGILPPPSVTLPQINVIDQVLLHKDNIINFMAKGICSFNGNAMSDDQIDHSEEIVSLLKPSHSLQKAQTTDWPDARNIRQHGLCYNICKASETIEYLNLSVIERFIGSETSSSYQQSPSSTKKNSSRMKSLCKSPGNRLSHLAKRRAIFSSLHLASNQQKSTMQIGPQVLLDKKKIKNRRKGSTPKRLNSAAKKDRNTPKSSARKRLFRSDISSLPSRESSKRALFQSPPHQTDKQQNSSDQRRSSTAGQAINTSTRRCLLFTPTKRNKEHSQKFKANNSYALSSNCTNFETLLKRKRNHMDDADNEFNLPNHKIFKANNTTSLTARALQIKSQSFCEGSAYAKLLQQQQSIDSSTSNPLLTENQFNTSQHILNTSSANKLPRTYSDFQLPHNSLTDNQKKKLLWAISQALQEKKINAKHPQFKQYAATLAKAVKRIFQEYYQKSSTSNSETLLRLSKRYVYYVISGSTVDEIYSLAKQHIEESKRQANNRTTGLLDYLQRQVLSTTPAPNYSMNCQYTREANSRNKQHTENVNTSTECLSATGNHFVEQIIQSAGTNSSSSSKTPASSRNSSSKCNLDGLILSENVNQDLRRSLSAQKNFTGKDQKNLSPYTSSNHPTSAAKAQTQSVEHDLRSNVNIFKTVKRHIIFDS